MTGQASDVAFSVVGSAESAPWRLATSEDLRLPRRPSQGDHAVRLMQRYIDRVVQATTVRQDVRSPFYGPCTCSRRPALFSPRILYSLVRAGLVAGPANPFGLQPAPECRCASGTGELCSAHPNAPPLEREREGRIGRRPGPTICNASGALYPQPLGFDLVVEQPRASRRQRMLHCRHISRDRPGRTDNRRRPRRIPSPRARPPRKPPR